ncbi:MAG: dephospho-CoA kinase, partial [Clostridia bacterium]|nr:dephospho-CoA kinase [Clostridia bacterium]
VILGDNGEIHRKKLGSIVFSDANKLELLNSIIHPAITEVVKDMLGEYTIIDGAVIHKTPEIVKMCDYIIAVTNSDQRRIEFICKRDNIDKESASNRIKSQPDNDFYEKFADIVIHSDCGIEELYNKSVDVLKRCISEKNI